MNNSCFVGRAVRDAELRETASGKQVCRYTLAVDKLSRDKDSNAEFFDFIAFDGNAKYSSYIKKGDVVAVVGRLATNRYTDKNGNKRCDYNVVVETSKIYSMKANAGTEAKKAENKLDDGFLPYEGTEDLPF